MITKVAMVSPMVKPPSLLNDFDKATHIWSRIVWDFPGSNKHFFMLFFIFYRYFTNNKGQTLDLGGCPHYLTLLLSILFLCQEKFTRHLIPFIGSKGLGNA